MTSKGIFTISLDFEMMWGCHDWTSCEGYGASNIKNVPEVIDRLLFLFEHYQVKATVAIVGMLLFRDKTELLKHIPSTKPHYHNQNLSPYKTGFIENIKSSQEDLYFAPDIVEKLKAHPLIEVATHTFSHYFCWASGQTTTEFEQDIEEAIAIAKVRDIAFHSIIFPRNEVSPEYLQICSKMGLSCYRGNPPKYFNQKTHVISRCFQRVMRFVDAYNIFATPSITPIDYIDYGISPIDIPANRFLRPFNPKFNCLERLKVKRICSEMNKAARQGCIYHLWWHPHNMGANIEENFKELSQILTYYSRLKKQYGMCSLTMREIASLKS